MLDAPPSLGRLVSDDPRDFDADPHEWREFDRAGDDPDRLRRTAAWLRNDPARAEHAGMADDVTAAALADLLDVLPDNVADLVPGIGWQAGAGSRIVLGQTMAAPTVRRTRPR
jgi:hypothetical protein